MKYIQLIRKKYAGLSVVTKATLWFVFADALQKAIAVLTTPIFTRLMPAVQYGQVTAYNSWLQIFTILVTLRLNWSVFNKGMHKYKDDRDGYVSTMQTTTFALAGLLMGVYLVFRKQFNALTELPTMVMIAMFLELFVTPAISFWTLRKRYEYEYRQVVFRSIAMVVLSALIGLVAVYVSEQKGYARILSIVFVNMCFGIPIFAYNRLRSNIWFKLEYALYALRFNLKLLLHYISQYILEQFDRIMIQKMVGFAAAGIYGVAYNAAMLMKILTQSICNALVPWMYERLDKKEFRELDDVLFIAYLVVAGCVLMFVSVAPELMRLLADEQYQSGMYVIPPVAIGLFFFFVYNTVANMEFFYELTKFTSYISVVGAVLNIVLNYIGIRMFGYLAAAYTTLICYILFSVAHYVHTIRNIKKLFKLDEIFNVKRLMALSVIVLVAGMAVVFLYDKIVLRYVMLLCVITAIVMKKNILIQTITTIKAAKKK